MAVSEEFYDAIIDGGCLVQTCDVCGKTHYCTEDTSIYEKGELDEIVSKATEQPDRYVEHADCSSVHCGQFNGITVVYQCCEEWLQKYEELIWSHRFLIKKYLSGRAKKEVEEATLQLKTLHDGLSKELGDLHNCHTCQANKKGICKPCTINGRELCEQYRAEARKTSSIVKPITVTKILEE